MQLLGALHDWLCELRNQKMRTISTVMGIAWGTFGVVGIMAFGRGLEDVMHERAEGMGKGIAVAWSQSTTKPHAGYSPGRRVLITEEDVFALASQIPELESVCPEYIRWRNVQRGERTHNVPISGVFPSYADLRNMTVRPGGNSDAPARWMHSCACRERS